MKQLTRIPPRVCALLVATALAVTATGCDTSSDPTDPPGAPDKVTTGLISIVDVAPIYLGKEKGFFSKRNIDLTLQAAQGGVATIPAVVSGQYQFGFSNAISLMLAQDQGLPVKAVANGVNAGTSRDGDFSGLMVKDPAIQSAKDLEGKTVATNTLKNVVEVTIRETVKKAGGDPAKVNFVELPFPEMAAALEADRVNAIFVVEPFLAQAKSKGWRSIGSFAEIEPGLCVAVYFTSKQVAQSTPDLVKRYSEALRESLAYAETHPDEVRAILGTYTKINEDVRKQMVLPKWPAEINKASLAKTGELIAGYGLIKSAPDLTALLP